MWQYSDTGMCVECKSLTSLDDYKLCQMCAML